jgi:thioredoxin 1
MPPSDDPSQEPTREEVDRMEGPVLLEFGASWCPHCQALAPRLRQMLEGYPDIRHIKIEDGPGRPLGRSFRVKLWPNLVFLRDGQIRKQLARPAVAEVLDGLAELDGARSATRQTPEDIKDQS